MSNVNDSTRRQFLKNSGVLVAASTFVAGAVPHVHGAESNTIQVALVGCGGRGTGAAKNALRVKNGPVKLVAMADVFQNRQDISHKSLATQYPNQVDVPQERKFIGFDAYKKAIDVLNPGDVVIFATPPAFRWLHFTYAIERGVNVFMEKPVTIDGQVQLWKSHRFCTVLDHRQLYSKRNRGLPVMIGGFL